MIVIDHDEPVAIDALVVDVPTIQTRAVDAHAIDARAVEALVVEVRSAPVAPTSPVATGRGGALAQPAPEPIDLEIAEPGDDGGKSKRPDLRVAPDSYKRRRRVRIAAAAAAVSISVTLFAVVGFNVVLAQHQIELQSLQQKLQAEESRYYALREEVAQRSSPRNVVEKAKALGLNQLQPGYISAKIKPPPVGPTDTDDTLNKVSQNTGGILDHPVP